MHFFLLNFMGLKHLYSYQSSLVSKNGVTNNTLERCDLIDFNQYF